MRFLALGSVLFVIGGVDTLSQIAPELEPPRILNLQRTAVIVAVFSLGVTAIARVPRPRPSSRRACERVSRYATVVGLRLQLAGPSFLKGLMTAAVVAGAVLMMASAARSALAGAQMA